MNKPTYLRPVPNWTDPAERRRAVILLRDTIILGVPIDRIAEAMDEDYGTVLEFLNGRAVPSLHQLYRLKIFAKILRDDMRQAVRDTEDFFADRLLDRLLESDR
ncbi:MAG: hypothetical protein CMQ40_10850 [Gammaproteobacteria bacterium]|nr:hypothetical protein [Gammaproteobacteria bacterium]